ncbi:MAG: hypothetical protein HYY93_02350, partial [Planctomycetes bacterium]|nr:hypothetical protein [Planctomycetota bacterium]
MRPLRLSLALTALLAPVLLFYGEALTAGPGGAPPLGSEALSLLVTTIEVAGGATLLALLLGSAAALALQGVPPGWRPAILALCATPLLVPSAILTGAWLGMCAPAAPRGWAASACMALGGSARDPATFLYTPAGAAILGGLISWPWVTFAIRAAFAGIDPGAVESARLHGGRGRIWCAVLTPRLLPALGLGGLLAFTWTAADLGVPGLLAVRTSSALVEEAFGGWGDLRAGALCSLLPVTFSLVLALGVARSGVIRPGSFSDPRPSPGGEAALRAALPAPLLLL